MSDGSDNPILDMGLLGMMAPNPYLNPSLNKNPDGSPKPLALPSFYTGQAGNQPPTDAMGNPIQNFVNANNAANTQYAQQMDQYNAQRAAMTPASPSQGTTLTTPGTINYNAMGSAGAPLQELMGNFQTAQSKLTPQQQYDQQQSALYRQQALGQMNATAAGKAGSGFGTSQGGAFNPGQATDPVSLAMMSGSGGGAPPSQAAGPAPPSPPDMRQAYLDALANPGPLTKVGANVPASSPLGQPSVLTAFMAAHPGGGTKTGGYDNSGFFNTVNQLGRTA